jgi:hypothetical protein
VLEFDGDRPTTDPVPTDPAPTDLVPSNGRRRSADRAEQPDVLLDALVSVKEIKLDVQGLRANVQVNAEVANLVKLSVGADVSLDRVTLTITGVEVKALLEVRLDEVRAILDRALTLLIENPEILEVLARTLVDVVHEVGEVVTPVVQGVISGVVAPVVEGVVGGIVAPVVEGVVRGLTPPTPGPTRGEVGDREGQTPPAPGEAGNAAGPPAVQPVQPQEPVQPARKALGPGTDHPGPLLHETPEEVGQATPLPQALAADTDGVLQRAIQLLALLDKGDKW